MTQLGLRERRSPSERRERGRSRGKLVDHLLSEAHPDGHGKARFFSSHGFSSSGWQVLADPLRAHTMTQRVVESATTAFGVRYIIEGELEVPDGRRPVLRVV